MGIIRLLRSRAIRALPLLASAAAAWAAPAAAQTAAPGRTEAIVLRPFSFIKVDDLNMGGIIPNPTLAGTVRMFPNGTRSSTNGIVLVGATHQTARFGGAGTNNQQLNISVQANSIFLTGPGAPMRMSNFDIGSTPTVILSTTPRRFRIVSPTGVYFFTVGATLDVAANQAEGEYVGSFTINLNYL